jgi:YtkA-like
VNRSIALKVEATTRTRPRRRPLIGGASIAAVAATVTLAWLVWPTQRGPVVLHAGTPHYVVTATVDSARLGSTGIEIHVITRAGHPVDRAMVQIEAIMPLMGHAAPPVSADPSGGGRYQARQVPLMMIGPWELQMSIDAPDGVDNLTLPLSVSG